MALSGKMVSRITKATASSTHTANAIRASSNGGFSNRGTSVSRSLKGVNSPASGYGRSLIGQRRNKYQKALNVQEFANAQQLRDEYHIGYGRASEIALANRQEANAYSGREAGFARLMLEEQLQQQMIAQQHMESTGYGRTGRALRENRQSVNARAEQGGLGQRMAGANSRFEASHTTRGSFGGAGSNGGVTGSRFGSTPQVQSRVNRVQPRMSGATNATARPVPKPNFRRPS